MVQTMTIRTIPLTERVEQLFDACRWLEIDCQSSNAERCCFFRANQRTHIISYHDLMKKGSLGDFFYEITDCLHVDRSGIIQ